MINRCTEPRRPRPKFAQYLFDRRLSAREVSAQLGISHEHARRITLPFADPDYRRPSLELRQRIQDFTGGEVGLLDWSACRERADGVAEDVQ